VHETGIDVQTADLLNVLLDLLDTAAPEFWSQLLSFAVVDVAVARAMKLIRIKMRNTKKCMFTDMTK
jgi:hypothetical protein